MSLTAWFGIFGLLAVEAAVVLLIAGSAAKFARPVWQRTIWHAAMAVLLGLLAMESCGVGGAILRSWRSSHTSRVFGHVMVQTLPAETKMQIIHVPRSLRKGSEIAATTETLVWWPGTVWLAGIAFFLARPLGSRLGFWLLWRRRQPVMEQELLSRLDTLARRLGLLSRIRLSECQSIRGPIAFGIFRPAICLPARFAKTFSARQQEAMLVHELEHLRAHDPAWYLLAEITASFWWWLPLAWWARRNLHAATEQAADDASLLVEDGPELLAGCLVEIGKRFTKSASFNLLGIEGNGFRSSLGRRVTRLLKMQPEMRGKNTRGWRSVAVYSISFVALLFLTIAAASVESIAGTKHAGLAQAISDSLLRQNQPGMTRHEPALQLTQSEVGQASPDESFRAEPPRAARKLRGLQVSPDKSSPAEPADPDVVTANGFEAGSALPKRHFKIDPNTFARNLAKKLRKSDREKSIEITNVVSQFIPFLSSLGIDLGSPKNVYYNETQGTLMIRATLQDLDYIEEVVQDLSQSPPQLTIECKFVEFSYANPPRWFSGQWTNQNGMVQTATSSSTNLAPPELVSILTASQSREIFRELEARSGSEILSAPRVTTLSGRQAQIKIVDVTPFPIYPEDQKEKDRPPKFEYFELGPAIDLVPMVAADGVKISIKIVPSILEFLGYTTAARSNVAQPAPMFRYRQAPTRVVLWDGQTALLGLGAVESREKTRERNRRVYRAVFVTATIIDPAGNRVHPEDQLPFRNEGTPAQE